MGCFAMAFTWYMYSEGFVATVDFLVDLGFWNDPSRFIAFGVWLLVCWLLFINGATGNWPKYRKMVVK